MKRLFILIGVFTACIPAYATDTCLHDNTTVLTLWKSKNGVKTSSNKSDMSWTITFDYSMSPSDSTAKTLYGLSTCNEISTNTAGTEAKTGDANVYLRSSSVDIGTYCWCQMTAPVSSWWVFYNQYSDADTCASKCASECASAISNNTNNFRTQGVYMAIW